jgi:hypothetical protein
MTKVQRAAWAEATNNGDFICIRTCSGYRSTVADPQGARHLLPADVANQELGAAVLDSLAHSRFVPPQEMPEEDFDLFDVEKICSRYSAWVNDLMTTYRYKTKRALSRT